MENKTILKETYTIDAVDFKEYEKWLEEKALNGWVLKEIKYINVHTFEKTEPKKIRYCLGEDKVLNSEYKRMFKEFGWTLVHEDGNNYLWMMEYEGERPDAYNDIDLIEGRNKAYKKRLGFSLFGAALYIMMVLSTIQNKNFSVGWIGLSLVCIVMYMYVYLRPHMKFIKAYNKNKEIMQSYKEAKGDF